MEFSHSIQGKISIFREFFAEEGTLTGLIVFEDLFSDSVMFEK